MNFEKGNVSGADAEETRPRASNSRIGAQYNSLDAFFKGSLAGENLAGKWGGQFFGKGADGERPGSIGGTFGVATSDKSRGLVGMFGAYRE